MTEKTYRIGEVAQDLDLKSYVLRFWETEFPQLSPLRTDKGQRLYTEENVALLKLIKKLLHEQGMTIEGARRILEKQSAFEEPLFIAKASALDNAREKGLDSKEKDVLLADIYQELIAIRSLL